ncbi:MAG TPA: ankyrin repeat domain-containing protein [Gallionella sp.]|nr:ankyrin repeat domain-containing protein [Gallionella sp.]
MNEAMLKLVHGRNDLYPHALEKKFLRIFNRIVELWDTPQMDAYFTELMMDTRGGSRQGFPKEVVAEIYQLSRIHERSQQRAPVQPSDPWAEIEIGKRRAIEELGYECTPHDFLKAVESQNKKALAAYLSAGLPVDTRDERGWTPLMISAFNGNEEMAELLIRSGADVQIEDHAGYGPMHWAAFNGYRRVVRLLSSQRGNVNARSHHGWTPLLQAATRGHLDVCIALISSGANVNLTSNDGWSPLHKACANGHIEVVQLLLSQGADRNAHYQDSVTPLALAIKNKREDIVALLTSGVIADKR